MLAAQNSTLVFDAITNSVLAPRSLIIPLDAGNTFKSFAVVFTTLIEVPTLGVGNTTALAPAFARVIMFNCFTKTVPSP